MPKVNQEIYCKTIKYLISNDATLKQLSEQTGLHVITIGKLINIFKRHKLVHICDWEPDRLGRDQIMVIRWGEGKDFKRFKMSGKERQRLYRQRKREVAIHPVSLLA